jgi:hypothetical protein
MSSTSITSLFNLVNPYSGNNTSYNKESHTSGNNNKYINLKHKMPLYNLSYNIFINRLSIYNRSSYRLLYIKYKIYKHLLTKYINNTLKH